MRWNKISHLPKKDRTKRNPNIKKEKKSWEELPLVIESFYSWDDGFMVPGKVSILQQGCSYCPTERPPIISQPMHCYSLGIDMLHKSELLDCQVLFLQPVTWPACQGPHILVSMYWPDALRQRTVVRAHHYFSQSHTQTHGSTLCTPTHIPIFWLGLSYPLYIFWGRKTKQWHTIHSCFSPNSYLSTSRAFITEQGNTG